MAYHLSTGHTQNAEVKAKILFNEDVSTNNRLFVWLGASYAMKKSLETADLALANVRRRGNIRTPQNNIMLWLKRSGRSPGESTRRRETLAIL